MKNLKETLLSIGILIVVLIGLYYLFYIPQLRNEYQRGLQQFHRDTDTVFIPGKDSIIYKEATFKKDKPVVIEEKDSLYLISTSFDTSFVSGKDTIGTRTNVLIEINKVKGLPVRNNIISKWLMRITHSDYVEKPDTLKIFLPKYINTEIEKISWWSIGMGYVTGILTAVLIFFLAK